MRTTTYLTICFLLALFGATAAAQTPDGETPAVERGCDQYSGAAFGLCNAYCEAMDCELRDDGNPLTEPRATERACDRVAAQFMKATGTNQKPACPANPYPCWDVSGGDECLAACADQPLCAEGTGLCSLVNDQVICVVYNP